MGRMRVGVYTHENERGSSRPWDNVTDKMIEEGDSRYASLRVEHFVDAGIASRAAMFEGSPPPAALSVRVSHLASKYEDEDEDVVRPGSVVQPWPPSSSGGNILTDNTTGNMGPIVDPSIKTQLGRRSVKPPLMNSKPLPPVGLPMPDKSPAGPRTPVLGDRPEFVSPPRDLSQLPSPMKSTAAPMRTPTADTPPPAVYRNEAGFFGSPTRSNRSSARCSVRASPVRLDSPSRTSRGSMRLTPGVQRQSYRNSVRRSVRMSGASQIPRDFPRDSSFPASSSDLNPMPNGQQEYLDYSDPESLDTFGSLESEDEGNDLAELETPERAVGALPNLSRTKSEEAEFPEMNFDMDVSAPRLGMDDEGEVLDVPKGFVSGKEGGKALRDLQCASVTAGNELAEQVRQYAAASELTDESNSDAYTCGRKEKISRAQGELELRSRFFRRWNTRYVSIVDHAYFGAVLFLFRHDNKSNQGTIALKNSKMIVLAGSQVRELEGHSKKNGPPALFELRTAQRKYVFACLDDTQRQFWIDQLTSFAAS